MSNSFDRDPFDQLSRAPNLPKQGNWLTRSLARAVLRLLGWRPVGALPDYPQFVIVGGPHTSYWDAVLGVLTIVAAGLDLHWMAKKEAFVPRFGGILRWLGGVPVDRQAPGGIVRQIVDQFEERDRFVVVVTPEGTRKRVDK